MNARDANMDTSPEPPDRLAAVPAERSGHGPADPWLRVPGHRASGLPAAGQPGHGRTASLRRQPARIVEGRMEGGYTEVFELICGECGDHPYVDYRDIPPRLQQIRGPYPLEAGLKAYAEHLGQASCQRVAGRPEDSAQGLRAASGGRSPGRHGPGRSGHDCGD
jgi:hypothetical protein